MAWRAQFAVVLTTMLLWLCCSASACLGMCAAQHPACHAMHRNVGAVESMDRASVTDCEHAERASASHFSSAEPAADIHHPGMSIALCGASPCVHEVLEFSSAKISPDRAAAHLLRTALAARLEIWLSGSLRPAVASRPPMRSPQSSLHLRSTTLRV